MLTDLLIFLLSSLGCLIVYATSRHQKLFASNQFRWQQLPKGAVWLVFGFAQANSLFLLADQSSWSVAMVKVIGINITLWLGLILLSASWPQQPIRVSVTIFSGFLGLVLLGV